MAASGHRTDGRGDVVLRVGAVLVAIGTVATIATLLPLATGGDARPVAVYLLCFLAPIGLGAILVALWQRASSRSRRIRSSGDGHRK